MSVINQMLKDLDQRQVEQQGSSHYAAPVAVATSNNKVLLLSLFVIVLLNVIGLFVWQMYVENQALKQVNKDQIQIAKQQSAQKEVAPIEKAAQKSEKSDLTITPIVASNVESNTSAKVQSVQKPKQAPNKATETSSGITKIPQNSLAQNLNSRAEKTPHVTIQQNNDVEAPRSKLKISRKQLSPRELAQQKVKRAEQALANNDIAKAESLFEDVLLILPEHKSARKQLAALWFGRKSYSPALNLLSQGIALSPTDTEFRVMQARIYLQQNRAKKAFDVLNKLPQVNSILDVEYQSLRASVAQQSNQFTAAAEAYQTLTTIEPLTARWWLGLAVAHDSNSEFKQASIAYTEALTKAGLSDSAESFVRQRITELGE